MDYQDLNTIVEYKEATTTDWNSLTIPIGMNMLVYATDTGIFKIGDGTKSYAQLNTAFTRTMDNLILDLASKIPTITGGNAGKVVLVNEAGNGFVISDTLITELLDSVVWANDTAAYASTEHTHDDVYIRQTIVDDMVDTIYPKPLSDQDTLSYIILNQLKRDDDSAIVFPDSIADEYVDNSGLDNALGSNQLVSTGTLITEPMTTTLASIPVATTNPTTTLVGTKIYAMFGSTTVSVNTVRIYNILTDTWSTGATGPSTRRLCCGTVLGTYIYIYGGYDDTLGRKDDFWRYDTLTDTWLQLTGGPGLLSSATLVTIDGLLYLYGGYTGAAVKKLWVYNPNDDEWTQLTDGPTAIRLHTAVVIDNKMYVYGGNTGAVNISELSVYDPDTAVWNVLANGPVLVSTHAAVAYNDKMYIFGGVNAGSYKEAIWSYNPVNEQWIEMIDGPIARQYSGMVVYNHRLYIVGGNHTSVVSQLLRYPINSGLHAVSDKFITDSNIDISRVYVRGVIPDINDNTLLEVSRDDGVTWAGVEMELSPLSVDTDIAVYTGNTTFDKVFSKNTIDLSEVILQDYKGSVTTFTVDTENLYGHVNSAISSDMNGVTLTTSSGSVVITNVVDDGTGVGSITFTGTLATGSYNVIKITKMAYNPMYNAIISGGDDEDIAFLPISISQGAELLKFYATTANDSNIFTAVKIGDTYQIYRYGTWVTIAREVMGTWEYRSTIDGFTQAYINSAYIAVKSAIELSINQMTMTEFKAVRLGNLDITQIAIVWLTGVTITSIYDAYIVQLLPATLPEGTEARYSIRSLQRNSNITIHGIRVSYL